MKPHIDLQQRRGQRALARRDTEQLEFVIATIPTSLAIDESSRLRQSLQKMGVACTSIVVNQIIGDGMGDAFLKMKLKEQAAAMRMLQESAALAPLDVIHGKMLDLEVKGIPALGFFASTLWAGLQAPAGSPSVEAGIVRAGAAR